jgi:TPR repeat protein
MKASRLMFTLLLASSVAVVQLAAQQAKADQKPIEEVKAKAEAGDAESEVELGLRYEQGKGVAKDQVEAVKWYRKAAEQNLAAAQNDLGACFYNGDGVTKDPVEAVKWFRKAAEQNFAAAQFNLGVCYADGEGVAKDEREALFPRGGGIRWRR